MPFPDTASTVHGGCNCGSIRYRIDVPELSKRVPHPFNPSDGSAPQARFPLIATCHCNDCRMATAGLLGGYICAPASMISVSCLSPTSAVATEAATRAYDGRSFDPPCPEREAVGKVFDRTQTREQGHGRWQAGMDMLTPTDASRDSFVRFFHSSPRRTRAFCGRCGTNISYNVWPMVAGYPDIIDIVLGTVDREDLEGLKPENQLWWNYGIDWIKDMSKGLHIPIWANSRPDEIIEIPK